MFHRAGPSGRGTSSKLDDAILRDRDANTTWGNAGDGTAEERTYYAQNWRGDVVALLDSTGGRRETIAYSAYGTPFGRPGADVDGNGSVVIGDKGAINGALGESYGDPGYTVKLDVNLDGTVDATDSAIANAQTGYTLGRGALSRDPGLSGGVGNRIGYAGYAWEPASAKYHVRHRVLDPLRGRWSRRDPLGYVDSPTAYAYVDNRAMTAMDPSGLSSRNPQTIRPVCPKYLEVGSQNDIEYETTCEETPDESVTCTSYPACGPWLVDPYDEDNDGCGNVIDVTPGITNSAQCSGPCYVHFQTTWVEKRICAVVTICSDGRNSTQFHSEERHEHATHTATGTYVHAGTHCECHFNHGLCPSGIVSFTPYPIPRAPWTTPITQPLTPVTYY